MPVPVIPARFISRIVKTIWNCNCPSASIHVVIYVLRGAALSRKHEVEVRVHNLRILIFHIDASGSGERFSVCTLAVSDSGDGRHARRHSGHFAAFVYRGDIRIARGPFDVVLPFRGRRLKLNGLVAFEHVVRRGDAEHRVPLGDNGHRLSFLGDLIGLTGLINGTRRVAFDFPAGKRLAFNRLRARREGQSVAAELGGFVFDVVEVPVDYQTVSDVGGYLNVEIRILIFAEGARVAIANLVSLSDLGIGV